MTRARPRRLLSTVALAVPTSLLAVGWLLASLREESARLDKERRDLAAEAHAVSAAVSEGLEELRAREDERPYYHYTYYFAPPDVLSVGESLAVSPLGSVPTDARLSGHFQVDPGAVVRSPLESPEAPQASRARGQQVITAVSRAFAPSLAALTQATPPPSPNEAPGSVVWNQVQNLQDYNQRVLSGIRDVEAGKPGAEARAYGKKAPERKRVNVSPDPSGQGRHQAFRSDGTVAAVYTPMVFRREGDTAILYRTVTTDGASSVQGALLDLRALRATWLPAVARRHAAPGSELSFVPSTGAAPCVARAPLPSPIDDLAVCASGQLGGSESSLGWQVLALGGVLALVAAATAERLRALRRAEELAGIERAFVASVSHELRTPLTTFRLHAEMLQEGLVSEARKPRVLAQLVEESHRLARLIEDVLTFGRLSDGDPRLDCKRGDLGAHVRGIVERERPRLEAKGLSVELACDEGVFASFDARAVDQIVTNLLDNALKYAGSSAEPVVISVKLGDKQVRLCVTDRGPGVPAAERERVFDRFYRSSITRGSHVAGTGLGLAIVRGLARAMKGDARLSEPSGGKGCSVEVSLPCLPADDIGHPD